MNEFMPERRSSLYRLLGSNMFYHVLPCSAMMVRHHSDNGTDEIIVRCGAISMGQIHNRFVSAGPGEGDAPSRRSLPHTFTSPTSSASAALGDHRGGEILISIRTSAVGFAEY